jgi:hypothetical protein
MSPRLLGAMLLVVASSLLVPAGARADGSFTSSDPQLNAIWAASVRTALDMIAPGPLSADWLGRPCAIGLSEVILDGLVRDRCPYIGDESVIDRTLDASSPHWELQRAMLGWFANAQHGDGSIPASPIAGGQTVLFDYNAYWLIVLHDYVLYSGDVALARELWPNVVRLIDGFYASKTLANGLVRNDLGANDYAFIRRRGNVVAYFNAQYALALERAAELATWVGDAARSAAWTARARAVAASFPGAFWDPAVGAFADTTTDRTTHPQDGNVFAALAHLASPGQTQSALTYIWNTNKRDYGNTISDSQTWDGPDWGQLANQRVYPFISYFELTARFELDEDDLALELIRREWGYMLTHGPGTMWETIGPYGGGPTDGTPSYDAGWSSGAAPALTRYVLGVEPTSPGFATFTVTPHVDTVGWAEGDVPTPRGPIHVYWAQTGRRLILHVTAPPGTTWQNRPGRPPLGLAPAQMD